MDTIASRVRYARNKTKLSQDAFGELIGVSREAIQSYEQGKTIPSGKSLLGIHKHTQIEPSWILTGVMSQNEYFNTQHSPIIHTYENAPIDTDIVFIPLVGAILSAGGGSFETDASVEKYLAFRRDFLCRKGVVKEMVLMRVSGDSMNPEIQNNDVVLIDQSKKTILADKIYAVGFGETVYLKKINKLPNKLLLESINKEYAPIEVATSDMEDVRILGKIVWWCREVL